MIVATLLENPYLDMQIVFVQLVAGEEGLRISSEEDRRNLEAIIFHDAKQFQPRLQGYFSWMKKKVKDLSLDEAVDLFNNEYLADSDRWDDIFYQRLKSEHGQSYIRLRLKDWAKR